MLHLTAFYTGLCALLLIYFSVAVIRCRVKHKVVLLDGGVDILARHCRAHANFTEYTPMILLTMVAGELMTSSPYVLHFIGVSLILGRVLHFYSITNREVTAKDKGLSDIKFRQAGMALTFTALGVGAFNALLVSLHTML